VSELVLRTIPNGRWVENCYLLADPETNEAVLVDPGEEPGRALAALRHGGCRLRAVWLTHGHVDHVLGVGAVKEATGAPIFLHPADRFLYDEAVEWADPPGSVPGLPPPDAPFSDGDRVSCGRFEFRVRHLPGHSPGHVVLLGEGLVLGGDVLFDGSIGRTDLPGGDHAALIDGIHRVLLPLADDTIVYPGHGRPTTIGVERETNPFLGAVRSRA
jgi:glyoxylase-like metal-dependent hydrolase (beta-lactamase superfamily II)